MSFQQSCNLIFVRKNFYPMLPKRLPSRQCNIANFGKKKRTVSCKQFKLVSFHFVQLSIKMSVLRTNNFSIFWHNSQFSQKICLIAGPMQAMSTSPPLPYVQVIQYHKENIILVWFVFLMIQNILDHSLSSTMPVWFFANILKMVKLRDQDCELFSCFWFFYNPVQYITKIARDSCQRFKLNSFLKIWKAREVKNACCCKMSGTRFCFKLARSCHTATKIVWWPKDQCCHQGFKKWQNYC